MKMCPFTTKVTGLCVLFCGYLLFPLHGHSCPQGPWDPSVPTLSFRTHPIGGRSAFAKHHRVIVVDTTRSAEITLKENLRTLWRLDAALQLAGAAFGQDVIGIKTKPPSTLVDFADVHMAAFSRTTGLKLLSGQSANGESMADKFVAHRFGSVTNIAFDASNNSLKILSFSHGGLASETAIDLRKATESNFSEFNSYFAGRHGAPTILMTSQLTADENYFLLPMPYGGNGAAIYVIDVKERELVHVYPIKINQNERIDSISNKIPDDRRKVHFVITTSPENHPTKKKQNEVIIEYLSEDGTFSVH